MGKSIKTESYLTSDGYKDLERQYESLIEDKRLEVAKRIQQARDMGSLDDNLEYQAAMEELALVEGRIAELETLLKTATIIEKDTSFSTVKLGSTVVVQVGGEIDEFTIVGSAEAEPALGKISNESPVGRALMNKTCGDIIVVSTEVLETTYKIVEIK